MRTMRWRTGAKPSSRNARMKLLYASIRPPYPFMQGGASRSAHYLLSTLTAQFGVECRAVGAKDYPGTGWSCPRPKEYAALGITEIKNENDRISVQCGYSAQVRDDFRATLPKLIDEFAPDVVWTQLDGFESIARIAAARGRRALVFLRDAEASPAVLKSIAASGCRIVCNSQFIAREAERITGKSAPVIYPSLDSTYGVSGDPQGVITMINPHRVKGIDTFLDIARRMPDESFLIVESWILSPSSLAALREKIALLPNVRFQHRVPDVGRIYEKTKLLLAPSAWEEAFGRVVIEAQSCSIPVIASERGGLPEAVGDGGLCVSDYLSADAWVAAIERVLRDPDIYQRLAQAGYRHATGKLFSSREAASRFFAICSESLSDPGTVDSKSNFSKKGFQMTKKSKPTTEEKADAVRANPASEEAADSVEPRVDAFAPHEVQARYIFFSGQRTGSTYLCRRLCNVKDRFGLPMEYLNPKIVQGFAPELAKAFAPGVKPLNLREHLRSVERVRTTPDGSFGIKIQPQQLLPLLPRENGNVVKFLARYERIVVLTRRDKLGQAVSGALAQASGKWFDDGADPNLDDKMLAGLCPDVAFRLSRYVREEVSMRYAAGQTGRPVLYLDYEEILAEPDAIFDRVLVFLGEPRGVAGVEETDRVRVPQKAAGALARRLREQFLDFIAGTGAYALPGASGVGEKAE